MSPFGRKQSFILGGIGAFQRPVLVRTAVQPGRTSAKHRKPAIRLYSVGTTATDPKEPLLDD